MERPLNSLDTVELAVASGRWPPGTLGTVVKVTDDGAIVEIDDERGHTRDWLALPSRALRVVEAEASQQESLLA